MTADHVNSPFRSDDCRRVFIDANAEQTRTTGNQRQQAPGAIALAEMLVDDRLVDEAKSADHLGHTLAGRRSAGAEGAHVRAKDGGPGTGSSHGGTAAPRTFNLLLDRRATQARRKPELVPTGDEDAGRGREDSGPFRLIGMVAIMHKGNVGGTGAEFEEYPLVSLSGGFD